MSEKLDAILQRMAELQQTVKEHQGDRATLDWDTIKTQFGAQIEALVAAQVQEKMDRQPAFRIPGAAIAAYEVDMGSLKGNRYARMIKDFARDGYHKGWTQEKVKPVDLYLAARLMEKANAIMPDRAHAPSDDLKAALKALDSTTAGAGDELVPTDLAAQLWEDFFLASRVVNSLIRVPMPTNPFEVPLGLGQPTWRKGSENTATTQSNLATAKSTLTATELVTEQAWSYTLDEDAIIALMPAHRMRLAQSGAEIIDDFALNADSTTAAAGNVNSDDAAPAANAYYLSDGQDGIRHQWIVDNTDQDTDAGGDALADADLVDALAKMGKYAADLNNVVMYCDVSTYLAGFLNLTNVVTVDKFGPGAVVLTGQLAAYRGVPIVVSASHPLCEADGKVSATAANNTLGSISIVNRAMWYAGFRRDLLIEVDRDIQRRQFIMVTSLREAIAAHGTRSTNTHTAGIRNISL